VKLNRPLISAPVKRVWCRWRIFLIPIAVLLCVTLPHLSQGDWRSDTGWYGAIGVQAWRTGNFLSLESQPGVLYFNKPPLALWIHGLFLDIFGIDLAAARVPTVLAAAVVVLATVAIARRLGGRRVALWSGMAVASSYEFFRRTREISLDMWQLAFVMIAVWAFVGAVLDRDRRAEVWRALAGGAALGAALLCKPLVALACLPVLGVWCVWIGAGREWTAASLGGASVPRVGRSMRLLFTMLAAAILAAGPWHLAMIFRHGAAFIEQYFGAEMMKRAAGVPMGGQSRHQPVWFYVAQIFRGYWPWLIFTVAGLVVIVRGRGFPRGRMLRPLALVMFVGWLTLLTAFPDRRDRYAQPLYPALAWISAIGVMSWSGTKFRAWRDCLHGRWIRLATRGVLRWGTLVAVLVGVVAAAIPMRVQSDMDPQWSALFAWMNANPGRPLWDGAASGAPAARMYLESGEWPRATRGRDGWLVREPGVGELILYHARGGWRPGVGEVSVFEARDLVVTRLEALPWSPEAIADPGVR